MSPGAVDDMNAPKSMKNIVLEVMEFVERHRVQDQFGVLPDRPTDFDTYDRALHVIWPDLFKTDPKAAILVSVSIYIDIAERWGFEVKPDVLKEMRL